MFSPENQIKNDYDDWYGNEFLSLFLFHLVVELGVLIRFLVSFRKEVQVDYDRSVEYRDTLLCIIKRSEAEGKTEDNVEDSKDIWL